MQEQIPDAFRDFLRRAERSDRIRTTIVWICGLLSVATVLFSIIGRMPLWLLLFFFFLYVAVSVAPRKRLRNAPLDCDPRIPFLFSRSFTDKKLVQGPSRRPGNAPYRYPGASLIYEVDTRLYKLGRSILLGDELPSDPYTKFDFIAIHDIDEHWEETFRYLASACRAVFIIPSDTTSVRVELRMLIECGYLQKTLVLMPPASGSFTHFLESEKKRFGNAWGEIREVLQADMHLDLPEYTKEGMLYVPDDKFSAKRKHTLGGSLLNLGDAVRQLLSAVDRSGEPLYKIVDGLKNQGFHQTSLRTFDREDSHIATLSDV